MSFKAVIIEVTLAIFIGNKIACMPEAFLIIPVGLRIKCLFNQDDDANSGYTFFFRFSLLQSICKVACFSIQDGVHTEFRIY